MDIDLSMDVHAKSVDMDMDRKFHIHGNPEYMCRRPVALRTHSASVYNKRCSAE